MLFQKLAGDFSDSRQTVAQESIVYRAYARVRYTDARDESRQIVHFFAKSLYNNGMSCFSSCGKQPGVHINRDNNHRKDGILCKI